MSKKNKKGFTLAELLIVVAIIAVLVAISIPIFSSQLEKSRKAVDLANVRSAKAAAAAEYMNTDMTESKTYYYDAATGTVMNLAAARGNIKGYGKSHHPFDKDKDGASGTPNTGKASGVVAVTIKADGTQSAERRGQGQGPVQGWPDHHHEGMKRGRYRCDAVPPSGCLLFFELLTQFNNVVPVIPAHSI